MATPYPDRTRGAVGRGDGRAHDPVTGSDGSGGGKGRRRGPGSSRSGPGKSGYRGGRGQGPGPGGRRSGSGPSKRFGSQGAGPKRPATGKGRSAAKRIPPPPAIEGTENRDGGDRDRRREAEAPPRVERVDQPAKAGRSGAKRSRKRSVDVGHIDFAGVPAPTAAKLQRRLGEAARAFEAERFVEAEKLLASIDRLAPGVAEVHELRGLVQYRLGHWVRALRELERFAELSGSVEQHPVLADCCRALKRWTRAEELWRQLGEASPAPELIEEGRIVQAGALADRGRLDDAIRFMERAPRVKGKPGLHHLRRWYMLADLYERVGDNARARRLFGDIVRVDPDFGDAVERFSDS